MIEYIYFVKCPNCEDEHFDFFDEAKEYAMGCLSKNPIITQVEVCRNDFGECTDSTDLGTIWSSDYVIADVDKEPSDTPSLLTKDFLNKVGTEEDPEFAALDNSVDAEEPVEEPAGEPGETSEISEISAIDEVPDNFRKPLTEASEYDLSALVTDSINHLVNDLGKDPWSEDFADEVAYDLENNYDIETVDGPLNYNHWFDAVAGEVSRQVNRDYRKDTLEENFGVYFKKKEDWDEFKKLCDEIGIYTMGDVESFMRQEGATPDTLLDTLRDYRAELGPDFKIKESRKPVPDGMTIEQLVEEMEENEDMVECTWCNDLFPKDECRKEVDLGYLCSRCEAAIKSRGEKLTFVENDYWDFLDEEIEEPKEPNSETRYWKCFYDNNDVAVIEAADEDEAMDTFMNYYNDEYFFDSWDHDWFVDEISKEEYDEWEELHSNIPPELRAKFSLTEGAYDFEHIASVENVKAQILDQLATDTRFTKCFKDGQLHATYHRRNPGSYLGYSIDETITDFEVTPSGRIIITLTRHYRDGSSTRKPDLETVFANVYRNTESHALLKAIKDIATGLNKSYRPRVAVRRDKNVFETLVNNPEATEELKNHIKRIEYRIPLLDNYPDEFHVDKSGELLTDKALNKLNEIYKNFSELPFADNAIDAGLVKNRPASEDVNRNIENSWACVGNITFDCPISDLSQEAQAIISGAKLKTDMDLKTDTYTTSCYRLINALAKYYGDNIFFYENKSEPLVASLDTEELTEATPGKCQDCGGELKDNKCTSCDRDYNLPKCQKCGGEVVDGKCTSCDELTEATMTKCPECGTKKAFDKESGVCNNCGYIE